MGFGDLFQKRSHHQHRKSSSSNSNSSNSSAFSTRTERPHAHIRSPTFSPGSKQPQPQQQDPILQYVPDPAQYPNSHSLTKQLIREGLIRWNCCKCGNIDNAFAVHRGDLDPDNLVQPFFLWGDSFCYNCSHNFCSTCIEGHTF